jgi:hypothetical protein
VDEDAGGVDIAAAEIVVDNGFDFRYQQRLTGSGVPGDVEVDFGVVVARYGGDSGVLCRWLKPNGGKPRERG